MVFPQKFLDCREFLFDFNLTDKLSNSLRVTKHDSVISFALQALQL